MPEGCAEEGMHVSLVRATDAGRKVDAYLRLRERGLNAVEAWRAAGMGRQVAA